MALYNYENTYLIDSIIWNAFAHADQADIDCQAEMKTKEWRSVILLYVEM